MTCEVSLVVVIVADTTSPFHEEIMNIQEKIEELIDYPKICDTINECQKSVLSVRDGYIVLIVTPDMIHKVFEQNIHQIHNIQSIFLFDPKATMHPDSVDEFTQMSYKMQNVCSVPDHLCQCLWKWVREFTDESNIFLSILASYPSDTMTTNVVNNIADFAEFWYPLYIDFLLDLPIIDPVSERYKFIKQCRIYFAQNEEILKQIDDFEANYTPETALDYYSRDGFVYRVINRALRQQNIDAIISFRFLLHDIRDQLRSVFEMRFSTKRDDDFSAILFRGQRMSINELNRLQKKYRAGTLITVNSYLSTSMDRARALQFVGGRGQDIVPVLFEITVQTNKYEGNQRKPFADIGTQSHFGQDEAEVLFSIGSFFKINKIFYDESEKIWIVQIIYVNDDDANLEITQDYRTLRACSHEAMIVKVGNLLADHPQQGISVATKFYKMIMELKFSETLTAACYTGLGWLALKEKNLTSAIELQHTALDHYEQLAESKDANLTHLRIMSYNCIGTAYRLKKEYKQALTYFLTAKELVFDVPIDKYAMYNGYRNVTKINIALTYKLMNDVDRAWNTYKNILAYDMNSSNRFHGHTYLTIAQAGFYEAKIAHDVEEYERCSLTWKAFLDISLTSMSSNYRRSIISGVLDLGFEYANNEQTWAMAIDYYQKVIINCQKYVSVCPEDYRIVLQCHNHISRLYTKKRDYDNARNYALKALQMCSEHDLIDVTECYKSLAQIYENRLSYEKDDLTPEDIAKMIMTNNPFASVFNNINAASSNIITFDRSEFAFGQFSINKINPAILQDTDRTRQLVYCLLKMAALAQMQGYQQEEQANLEDDDLLKKQAQEHTAQARKLIHKANGLLKDNLSVQRICVNNLAYIEKNFESIIEYYLQDLNIAQQKGNATCIGEDAFYYIAHLYRRLTNIDKELQWYKHAVQYFLDHGHICEHTVVSFYKLAHFYEKHSNLNLAVGIYQSLIAYLLKHKPSSFLCISIEPIVQTFIQHFNEKGVPEQAIVILQQLVELILIEPINDKYKIDQQFKRIIEKCKAEVVLVAQAYSAYLEMMLRLRTISFDPYICAVEPAFRQAISVHQTHRNYLKIKEVCEQFVELCISTKTDRSSIKDSFKNLGLDFEKLSLFNIALDMYTHFGKFIVKYQNIEDIVSAGLVITRCKFVKQKDPVVDNNIEQMLFNLMIFYYKKADPQFVLQDYLKTMKGNYERHSATGIYMNLLEFCLQHRSEEYNQYMITNIMALKNRPEELIAFVTTNRVNYKELILTLFEKYRTKINSTSTSKYSEPDFEECVHEWISSIEDISNEYWGQLLHCLLEWQSANDECIASCYAQMHDMKAAVSVFDTELYGDPALRFSPNACRRYLQYVYPQASSEQRINLENRYYDHFLLVCDSFPDVVSFEILSIE